MKLSFSAALALLALSTVAGPFPGPVLPGGVGVNIHFTGGHDRDLDMIAAAGFKFARMDFVWAATERVKGKYDWSDYDHLTAGMERRGIRPYFILDYSNPLYETNDIAPQHPASVAAFARWAAAAARHFHGRRVVWEIWNEPNGGFWHPAANVAQYTALALATCKAIRRADPRAAIVAPACAGFDWPFLETFLHSGVLAYLDGVSVHPYRSGPPETAAADYQRLRQLIANDAPKGRDIPILSGEWGYSSKTGGVSLETQADYIARQQLFNLYAGVPISIWYDWKNDGPDPAENEHNFGTVTLDMKPKPAYQSIQTLTRELSGCRIGERYGTGSKQDFVLVLTNAAGAVKLAAWTLAQPHVATFTLSPPVPAESFSRVNGNGRRGRLKVQGNHFSVELNGMPKYIILGRAQLKPAGGHAD
ncbi:MAG: cellulase family glycosylhydrolase [Verrucomicrobiota bacterium]|nr:cellulase family glycosylhydrolase [Verrucomicrobiota bacterium]